MHKLDGTYLKLIPNHPSGDKISLDEITDYLSSKRIFDYNRSEIMNVLNRIQDEQEVEVKLFDHTILPEQETVRITISEDGMYATARFFPPSTEGKLMTRNDIISTAVSAGMKFGLLENVINDFIENRVYCTDIVIAKAMLPVEGKSAYIKYYFNTKVTRKPKMNADGTVDFHQLDLISHVEAGDVLAELFPMDPGKPGIDVYGKLIKQKPVSNCILRHSNKTQLTEDGLKLISTVAGHVYLSGDTVTVSDIYEIKTDIDMSTGDIDYNGSVTIKGNVRTGFTVKAKGTIYVEGVVEGATLISDAGIILSRGMQGMNRGKLITKGDVVAKFIENSEVNCSGSLTAEAILHSKVFAGKEINVTGKKGFVTGGELHSGSEIHVKSAGSTMGTTTILEVGVDPKLVLEYHELESKIRIDKTELYKLDQILDMLQKKYNGNIPNDKKMLYFNTKQTHDRYVKELDESTQRYEELMDIMDSDNDGSIIVDKTIYSGCKIIISNITYYVRQEFYAKRFKKDGLDIKIYEHEI